MKDTHLQIRVSPAFKELLAKQAEQNHMNTSEYIRFLVLEDVRRSENQSSSRL